jgi:excinuclease UvrABC helicase subunit UvrB
MKKFNYLKNLDEMMRDFFTNYTSQTYPLNNIMGETKTESGVDENGEWTKTTYQTPDGTYSSVSFIRFTNDSETNVASESNLKTESKKTLTLKKELDSLIKNQDFEKACEVRDQIKKLETNKSEIEKLRKELEDSIKNENFEDSIKLRDKIKKLEK